MSEILIHRHSGEGRNPVIPVCSGSRIRHPGPDPGPARQTGAFFRCETISDDN